MSEIDFPMTYADLEARPAWKHAFLEHCLVHQGEQHPETLIAKNDYALSLFDAGEFGRACDMLDDVVAQMRQVFGKRSRTTMVSTGNFALALMAIDDAQKAYAMQRKVFKWHRRHSGELHPDTLLAMAYLANICFHMGAYDEARDLEETVYAENQRQLGDEHPETVAAAGHLAYTLNSLAVELRERGQLLEAEEIQVRALKLMVMAHGARSLDAAYTYSASGALSQLMGDSNRAAKFFKLAVRIRRCNLGEDAELTLKVMQRLSRVLH